MKKTAKILSAMFLILVVALTLAFSASANSNTDQPLGKPVVTVHNGKLTTWFSWQPVIGADFYRIYKSVGGSGSSWIYVKDTTDTDYNVNLTKDKDYNFFAIRAGSYEKGRTVLSPVFTTLNITKTKTSLFQPDVTVTQTTNSISLSWDSQKNAEGYIILQYVSDEWKELGRIKERKCTFNNIKMGTKYTFTVTPYFTDSGKTYVVKKFTPIYTATKTTVPTNITSKQNTSAIQLTWNSCPGATGYKIYYSSHNRWVALGKVTGTTAIIKNLPAGKEYTYAIRPYIINSTSVVWSDYATYTASTAPEAPELIASSDEPGQISVSWYGVSAEGYALYYKRGNGDYKRYNTYNTSQNLTFRNLQPGVTYTFAVRAYNRIPSGYILSSYTPVSVKVSGSSSSSTANKTLTNASATALWKEANRAYVWDFYDYHDFSKTVTINGGIWYGTNHPFVKTLADEREYLSQYFDDDIVEGKMGRFRVYNGELYVANISGMGIPPTLNSVTVKSQSGNYAELNVTMTEPGGYRSTRVQKMQYIDGSWKFTERFIYIHGDV